MQTNMANVILIIPIAFQGEVKSMKRNGARRRLEDEFFGSSASTITSSL